MRDAVRQDMMVQVLWYWMPVALYAGAIFFLSAQSHPEEQSAIVPAQRRQTTKSCMRWSMPSLADSATGPFGGV